jgi:hypothetical protein
MPTFINASLMAKSAEVPGMCTAAARPFKPSGGFDVRVTDDEVGQGIHLALNDGDVPSSELALMTAVPTAPL